MRAEVWSTVGDNNCNATSTVAKNVNEEQKQNKRSADDMGGIDIRLMTWEGAYSSSAHYFSLYFLINTVEF